MLEYYEAYSSLDRTIEFTENMIKDAAQKICGSLNITWGEDSLDLTNFRKETLANLVLEQNT
jgi:lysyl-tRNA synthetase class 2